MCLTSGVGFGAVAGRITSDGRRRDEVKVRRREGVNLVNLRDILQLRQTYGAFEAMDEVIREAIGRIYVGVWFVFVWIEDLRR